MRQKILIVMILMIIGVFVFSGRLSAEEAIGVSIFPKIDTPHPYPAAVEGNTLVWSKIIDHPGATWIKIHFSQFRLNEDDYMNLVDLNGSVIEQIKGKDVSNIFNSKFSVKDDVNKTVSFWGPAIEGNKVTVELHSTHYTPNRKNDVGSKLDKGRINNNKIITELSYTSNAKSLGFTIDEVGLGTKPLREDIAMIESTCGTYNLQEIVCYYGHEPFTRGQAVGRMYYEVYGHWFRSNGFLCSCNNSSTFLAAAYRFLINSPKIVATLEVQFGYQYNNCDGTGLNNPITYYGDQYIMSDPDKHYCLVTLKNNPQCNYTPLVPLNREPILNENIYLVQHPNGEPKKIGFGNVSSTGSSGLYFYHYVDTLEWHQDRNCMGSPVLTDDGDDYSSNDWNDYRLDKVLGFDYLGSCPNAAIKMSEIYAATKPYHGCN